MALSGSPSGNYATLVVSATEMTRLLTKALGIFCLFLPSLFAGTGLDQAVRRADWPDPIGGKLAVADFDKDQKLDGAVLLRPDRHRPLEAYRVEVHVGGRPHVEITFHSPGGVVGVSARDIDNDHDSDLVLEQSFTAKGVKVWINNGEGVFSEGRLEDYPDLDNKQPLTLHGPSHTSKALASSLSTYRSDWIAVTLARAAILPHDGSDSAANLSDQEHACSPVLASAPARAPPFSFHL